MFALSALAREIEQIFDYFDEDKSGELDAEAFRFVSTLALLPRLAL